MARSEAEKAERRAEYRRYLKGRIWAAIRGAAIYRAGGRCEWCAGTDLLQVHHLRYPKVFGGEKPEDLQVLCDPCHAEAHGQSYLIHKLSREKRQARKQRLKVKDAETKAIKRAKRQRRSQYYKTLTESTPPLKDRY